MASYFESLKGVQPMSLQIRLTGILLVGFSILEFAVGAAAYGFLSKNNVGGWWGAITTCLLGIASQYCSCRLSIWCILFLSCIAGAICIGAMVDDASHVLTILNSVCYSTSNIDETYGKLSKLSDVYNCPLVVSVDCICATNSNTCYAYHLTMGSNCGSLFSTYHGELIASSVCNAVLFLLCSIQLQLCSVNVGNREAVVGPHHPFEYLKGSQPFSIQIRLVGLILIGLSIAEIAVSLAAYEFLAENHVGAWWGAISTLVLGIISQFCNNRTLILCIMGVSLCAGGTCIFAVAVYGNFVDTIHRTGCYSTSNIDKTYGKENSITDAYNCPMVDSADCICSAMKHCYAYRLTMGSDCGTLFSVYHNELMVSCVCNAALSFLCILQFLFCVVNVRNEEAAANFARAALNSNQTGIPNQAPVVYPASDTVLFNGVRTLYDSVAASLGPQYDLNYPSAPPAPLSHSDDYHYAYPSHVTEVSAAYAPQQSHGYGYAEIYPDQVEWVVPVGAYLQLLPLDPNQVTTATEVVVAEPCV